jgi:hypothetical protein
MKVLAPLDDWTIFLVPCASTAPLTYTEQTG